MTTTNPDGSVKHAYSWGNTYESGNGQWSFDAPEDRHAAEQAQNNPNARGDRVGYAAFDD